MTTQSTEEPLDRLNYFNGQRLEDKHLKLEQEFHIRVRRLLSQALHTSGIASGLVVTPADNPHAVKVSPGVALDELGRAVILLDEVEVPVQGLPNTDPASAFGNFLFIEYAEEKVAAVQDGCTLASENCTLSWGEPTRIRAQPVLGCADQWPNDEKIILAQLQLSPSCEVEEIDNQVRKYVDAATSATKAYAFEGEKAIARNNPKKLSFHVLGGPLSSATLYLWASEFPSIHYEEIGAHVHDIPELSMTSEPETDHLSHSHQVDPDDLVQITVGKKDSEHGDKIVFPANKQSGQLADKDAINVDTNPDGTKELLDLGNADHKPEVSGGGHTHGELIYPAKGVYTTEKELTQYAHEHTTNPGTTEATGKGTAAEIIPGGTANRLDQIDALRVLLNGTDITDRILAQLGGPANGWDRLGDGTAGHPMINGTGAIDLGRIASLNAEENTLVFKVDNDSGGNIRYNLYVE